MSDKQEPSLYDVMAFFFRDPADHYDGLLGMKAQFDYEILEDHTEVQSLIPVGQVPNNDTHVCYTNFDDAPYLITARSLLNLIQGEDHQQVSLTTRRIAMLELEEKDIFEWLCDYAETDPVKQDEGQGNHSWHWAKPEGSNIVQDGFRLFIAPAEKMLLVDRIVTARV